eukprot:g3234.t1
MAAGAQAAQKAPNVYALHVGTAFGDGFQAIPTAPAELFDAVAPFEETAPSALRQRERVEGAQNTAAPARQDRGEFCSGKLPRGLKSPAEVLGFCSTVLLGPTRMAVICKSGRLRLPYTCAGGDGQRSHRARNRFRTPKEVVLDEVEGGARFLSVSISLAEWWALKKQTNENGVKTSTWRTHLSDKQSATWVTECEGVDESLSQKVNFTANLLGSADVNHEQRFANLAKSLLKGEELRGPRNKFSGITFRARYKSKTGEEVEKQVCPICEALSLRLILMQHAGGTGQMDKKAKNSLKFTDFKKVLGDEASSAAYGIYRRVVESGRLQNPEAKDTVEAHAKAFCRVIDNYTDLDANEVAKKLGGDAFLEAVKGMRPGLTGDASALTQKEIESTSLKKFIDDSGGSQKVSESRELVEKCGGIDSLAASGVLQRRRVGKSPTAREGEEEASSESRPRTARESAPARKCDCVKVGAFLLK